jgi:hypothetical protein
MDRQAGAIGSRSGLRDRQKSPRLPCFARRDDVSGKDAVDDPGRAASGEMLLNAIVPVDEPLVVEAEEP